MNSIGLGQAMPDKEEAQRDYRESIQPYLNNIQYLLGAYASPCIIMNPETGEIIQWVKWANKAAERQYYMLLDRVKDISLKYMQQ